MNRLAYYFDSPGFRKWCDEIDERVQEDFYAMLDVYQRCLDKGDAYVAQMQRMGFDFGESIRGSEAPTLFHYCLEVLRKDSKNSGDCMFQPVKIFQTKGATAIERTLQGGGGYHVANLYTGQGIGCFDDATLQPLNLLKPDVFVLLLSQGLFPMGDPTRELTNQTLSAHDLAHLAGFVAAPHYAKEMRRLFQHVGTLLQHNAQVAAALENFDSYYSLRLYYLIEVLCEVRNVPLLERVLGYTSHTPSSYFEITNTFSVADFPLETAKAKFNQLLRDMTPVARIKYMRGVCDKFHSIISPLGGESRDVLNRERKQKRAPFTFESGAENRYSAANSKFASNSIYSLYYRVKEALHELRSSHPNYLETACQLYSTFLAALTGTAQLTVTDWVEGSLAPVPSKDTPLYRYVNGLFDSDHLFWKAFCSPDYTTIAQ
jgi:hypothetical protein